jgi:hypothetical protein
MFSRASVPDTRVVEYCLVDEVLIHLYQQNSYYVEKLTIAANLMSTYSIQD